MIDVEDQIQPQEKLIQRPDVEWVSRPNYRDKDFFTRLEGRLENASRYITPDKLADLTDDQARTRIGRALHVYSMWSGRMSMYAGISPLLPEEFQNDYFSGLFGRARFIYRKVDDLGQAVHTALHTRNINPEDFPEELYGFGAVQLRLMEIKGREEYKEAKTDGYIETPDIDGETEEKASIDRDVPDSELAEMFRALKKKFDQETPLASFPAEEYLSKMNQLTRTYEGAGFQEALYGKAGLTERSAREVLRHMDMMIVSSISV